MNLFDLKSTFRNILRNKLVSFVSIAGLSLGSAIALLILSMINDLNSFDRFHDNYNQIYRVISDVRYKDNTEDRMATAPSVLFEEIRQHGFSGESHLIILRNHSGSDIYAEVRNNRIIISGKGFGVSPGFFEVFTFPIVKGDAGNSIKDFNSILITRELKQKLFGDRAALGEAIEIEGLGSFIVKAILRDIPHHSHLQFDFLVRYREKGDPYSMTDQYIYLKSTKKDLNLVRSVLEQEAKSHTGAVGEIKEIEYDLQPMASIIPGMSLSRQIGPEIGELPLRILIIILFLTVLATGINFSNMFISLLYDRHRSIGIRKVYGATKYQIARLLMTESVVISILAVIIAVYFVVPLKTFMIRSLPGASGLFTTGMDLSDISSFLLFAVITGLLLGILPSTIYGNLDPNSVIRGIKELKVMKVLGVRKSLISFQLFLFIFLMVGLIAVTRQKEFVNDIDLGFKTEDIRYFSIPKDIRLEEVNSLISSKKMAGDFSFSSTIPHKGGLHYRYVHFSDDSVQVQVLFADPEFFKLYHLEIERLSDNSEYINDNIIINQTLWDLVSEQKDAGLKLDQELMNITGIVPNFHMENIEEPYKPLVFINDPEKFDHVSLAGFTDQETLSEFRYEWNRQFNMASPVISSMRSLIDDSYRFFNGFLGIITLLILLISGVSFLGLFGLTSYLFKEKKKEISIRKILGAGFGRVYFSYLRSFLIIILISGILGCAFGSIVFTNYLNLFAFHVSIGVNEYFLSISALIVLLLISTLGHLKYLYRLNPAREVRNEA